MRGHATLIDGIIIMLHVTKITLPVYHVVADVRFIYRRSTEMFHDAKEFPKIARGYGICHKKNTSLTELGRFSEVLLVTACSSAKARSTASVCTELWKYSYDQGRCW